MLNGGATARSPRTTTPSGPRRLAPALPRRAPYRFTSWDADLLRLVATNRSQEDIAAYFDCSVSTIERRLATLRHELGVLTTIQVVVAAVRAGVI